MKIVFFLILCLSPKLIFTQTPQQQAFQVVEQLFVGMRNADSSLVAKSFHPEAILQTIHKSANGEHQVKTDDVARFKAVVAAQPPNLLDERLMGKSIQIDGAMAMIWTPYRFYLGDSFSHCGVNLFTLMHSLEGWQIVHLIDTRRKEGCDGVADDANQVHLLLDNWHLAAARADFDRYFNPLSTESIFLGTDETERWTKEQFQAFSKPYFDKGKAWDFKPYNRNLVFGDNGETVWFDELLETWMGTCRGSGVLQKINGEWKIQQYNLAVAVPNDKIQGYLKLLKGE